MLKRFFAAISYAIEQLMGLGDDVKEARHNLRQGLGMDDPSLVEFLPDEVIDEPEKIESKPKRRKKTTSR